MLRILVAEGNHINRFFLERALSRMGHSVAGMGDGRKVLCALARDYFHLALLDVSLDGLGNLLDPRAFSQALFNPRVIILGMGAPGNPESLDRGLLRGLDGFLTKPVDGGELAAQIKRLADAPRRSGMTRRAL
jgi:CheY-like chemotaxis protein